MLALGFLNEIFLLVAGVVGLIPAVFWFIRDLREKTVGSDALAIFSIVSSLAIGEYVAAAVIVLMLSTGRVLEDWAQGRAERELKSLLSRIPRTAHRANDNGVLEEIAVREIEVGNRLLVRSGEITATDGALLESATLDESALTGEPLPVLRESGENISSGVVNAGAPFYFTATTTADTSTYSAIVALVKGAQDKAVPGIQIAQKWALRFVPVALLLALSAWIISGDIRRAVTVLVIATPCPLILAVPIAVVAGLSRAAHSGAIIKNGAILELLATTETVLLDKTGTLTVGGPSITEINTAPGYSDDQLLTIAASLDQYSPHIVARAIVTEARSRNLQLHGVESITEEAGYYITGYVEKSLIRVGQLHQATPEWLHFSHPLMVSVETDGLLIGVIGLKDPIRPEARNMVAALRSAGVKRIALVTGDRAETAQEVADAVGITEIFSSISAEGKLTIARDAQANSRGTVVVVGDGINDAPALAAADVGVAMGARGASAASEAADVVIVEDSIERLTRAITIAAISRRKALQAAGLGMGLAFIGMVCGAFGLFTPSQGAIAQEIIDISAILWALTALRERN